MFVDYIKCQNNRGNKEYCIYSYIILFNSFTIINLELAFFKNDASTNSSEMLYVDDGGKRK